MFTRKKLVRTFLIVAALGVGMPSASSSFADVAPPAQGLKAIEKKLTISGLENNVVFTAQVNPKEIQVDKSVPWQKSKTSTSDQPQLEFSSADGRTMSFDLSFDTFETKTDVNATYIAKLLALSTIMDLNGPEEKRRPTRVRVTWGGSLMPFEGVIESVGTKYTMFLPDGTPVRATCSVKLKEASRASFRK